MVSHSHYSVTLFLFLFASFLGVLKVSQAADLVAVPRASFTVGYAVSLSEQTLYTGQTFALERKKEDHCFIKYDFEQESHIVRLPLKSESGQTIARISRGEVHIQRLTKLVFDKAYYLFSPKKPLPVLSKKGEKLELQVEKGGKTSSIALDAKYFKLKKPSAVKEKSVTLSSKKPTQYITAKHGYTVDPEASTQVTAEEVARIKAAHKLKRIEEVGHASEAICFIESRSAIGTGFLFVEGGNLYCYTNHHVLASARNFKIKTLKGLYLTPVFFELAADRDLARILIKESHPALSTYRDANLGEKVYCYGNSKGAGLITTLKGKVEGLNEGEVEVSCRFVAGNSGSPIVAKNNEVVGVATYVISQDLNDNWVEDGTRFEKPRRMGIKLEDDIEWLPVNIDKVHKAQEMLAKEQLFLDEVIPLMLLVIKKRHKSLPLSSIQEPTLVQWAKRRNSMVRSIIFEVRKKPTHETAAEAYVNLVRQMIIHNNYLSQNIRARERKVTHMKLYPYSEYMDSLVSQLSKLYKQAGAGCTEIQKIINNSMNEYNFSMDP